MDISVYTRPQKPRRIKIRERVAAPQLALQTIDEPLEVDSFTECHVTPPEIAKFMADYLAILPESRILEPSAGTGSLIDSVLLHGGKITAIERHIKLYQRLASKYEAKGIELVNSCFLDYAQSECIKFDRIIMNPPFSKAKAHVKAAMAMLEESGVLVALVPSTFELEGFNTIKTLGPDTFSLAKVYTKIVIFEK